MSIALTFFIGSHTGGQVTRDRTIPPAGTPVIQLDINPQELGRNYPIKVGLQGAIFGDYRLTMGVGQNAG